MGFVKQCMPSKRVVMGCHFIEQKDRLRKVLSARQTRPLAEDNVQQKRLLLTGRTVGGGTVFLAVEHAQIHAVGPVKRPSGGAVTTTGAAVTVDQLVLRNLAGKAEIG